MGRKRGVQSALLGVTALLGSALPPTGAVPGSSRPCDIYGAASTPCVAAHSLVRALYASYGGSLYRVRRASDNKTAAIGVTAAGGYADSAAQDAFCKGSDCVVDVIFDQSPNKNDLLVGIGGDVATGPGGRASPDLGVNASKLPLTLQGHKVYGAYVELGMGYRTNNTDNKPCPGLATGNEPETVYMVASGTHFNGGCCFDVRYPKPPPPPQPSPLYLKAFSSLSVYGSTAMPRRSTAPTGRTTSTGATKAAWRPSPSSTAPPTART